MVPSMPTCMHGGDLAGRDGVQADAQEAPPVVEIRHVRELAAEPVQGFDEDQIDLAGLGVHLHLLELGSESAGAALRPVGVDP